MTPARLARSCALALLLAAAAAGTCAAQGLEALLGRRVSAVRLVTGGREFRDPQIQALLEVRAGDILTMAVVRETIVHVMSMGRFLDVRVEGEAAGDGVAVSVVLVPLRDVRRLVFAGDLGVPESVLGGAVVDRFGPNPAIGRATDIARTLEEVLRDAGYLHAAVQPRPVGVDDAEAGNLVFEVACGTQARIGALSFKGTPDRIVGDLKARLTLKSGDAYQPADLRRHLAAYQAEWRGRGYFEARADVVPRPTAGGDRVDLVIAVSRGPLVTIEFTGDPLSLKQRDDLVPIAREGSADQDLVEDSEFRIRDFLRGQGYRDAEVTSSRDAQGDRLRIVLAVKRGPLYRVSSVLFGGTSAVPDADLRASVRTAAGQPFVQATLDADVSRLKGEYRRRGFGAASVTTDLVPVPGGSTGGEIPVTVTLTIGEGPMTTVARIAIAGASAVAESTLRGVLETRAGGPLYGPTVEGDRERLRTVYLNRGYRLVAVDAAVAYSDDRAQAGVTFTVREGPQVIVDHILVVGNSRINEATIRHEVVLVPGQPLALDQVLESQRRLAALGLFRRVTISELDHGAAHLRDVLVTVEEAPTTSVGYGGGVEFQKVEDVEFAPRGFFEIGRRNLWGKNRSVNLFSRVSFRRHSATTQSGDSEPTAQTLHDLEYRVIGSYREPRAFGTSADFQTAVAFEQGSRTSFSYRHRSARVALAQRRFRLWTLVGQYTIQRNEIFEDRIDPVDRPLIDRLFPQVRLGVLSESAVRDTRDDPIDPSGGTLVGVNGDLALRPIGSEVGFVKTYVQGFIYRRMPTERRVVLAGGVRIGLGTGFSRTVTDAAGEPVRDATGQTQTVKDLPVSERFFAGGDTTVRGFKLDKLGRPDTFDRDGTPIGGHAELMVNGEVRVAVWRDLGVVGFLDAGNVFSSVNAVNLGHLRAGTGFGVRYKSPVGPIRVDFGFKVGRLETYGTTREGRFALHISIGQAF
jgi:outer membrane protein insertion porin family